MGSLNVTLSGISLNCSFWGKKKKSSYLDQSLPKQNKREYLLWKIELFIPTLHSLAIRLYIYTPSLCRLAMSPHRTMGQLEKFSTPQCPLYLQWAWPMECSGNGGNVGFMCAYMVWLTSLHSCDRHKKSMPQLASIPSIWPQNETHKADLNLICTLDLN